MALLTHRRTLLVFACGVLRNLESCAKSILSVVPVLPGGCLNDSEFNSQASDNAGLNGAVNVVKKFSDPAPTPGPGILLGLEDLMSFDKLGVG